MIEQQKTSTRQSLLFMHHQIRLYSNKLSALKNRHCTKKCITGENIFQNCSVKSFCDQCEASSLHSSTMAVQAPPESPQVSKIFGSLANMQHTYILALRKCLQNYTHYRTSACSHSSYRLGPACTVCFLEPDRLYQCMLELNQVSIGWLTVVHVCVHIMLNVHTQ